MRKLIVLLTLCQAVLAQPRENKPLPEFDEKPFKVLDEGLIGWSLSKNGQWISSEMVIPNPIVSTNNRKLKDRKNQLGNDNISELQLFKMAYGKDSLVILVKFYKTGRYEFESTKKGWDEFNRGYYFVFRQSEFDKLKKIEEEVVLIKLPLLDYGSLGQIKKSKTYDVLQEKMVVKNEGKRFLTFTIQKHQDNIRFQFSNQHDLFDDVQGILNDYKVKGKSIYKSPGLLSYIYYEASSDLFYDFFSMEPSASY